MTTHLLKAQYACSNFGLQQLQTYCVEATSLPSGLKAAAMVDRGGGVNWQYVAEQRFKESPSAQLSIDLVDCCDGS